MRYALYIDLAQGGENTYIVNSARERDLDITNLKRTGMARNIMYCPIYKSGEYGKRIKVR